MPTDAVGELTQAPDDVEPSFPNRVVWEYQQQARLQSQHGVSSPPSAQDPYEGTLVCRLTVGGEAPRRVIVQFDQSDPARPTRRAAPMAAIGAFVSVPGVRVARGESVPVRVFDDRISGDLISVSELGALTLVARAAFPWVATAGRMELSCTGVDPASLEAPTATALRDAVAGVAAVEAAPPPDLEEYARNEENWTNRSQDLASAAIAALEIYLPFDDARLVALRGRHHAALDADRTEVEDRWNALFETAPRASVGSHPLGASGLTLQVAETPLCSDAPTRARLRSCFIVARIHNPTASPVVLRTEFAQVGATGDRERLELRVAPAGVTHEVVRAIPAVDEPRMPPGDTTIALGPKLVRERDGVSRLRLRLRVQTGDQHLYLLVAP